ncbi:helix-turn-helix domain-containing protein [Halorubrum sp. DTA98]|uniref:helix-turn-helix domain-containing protein n=1 Tax=Halorubrum sp. DTA98 TaxID=3402163 RepID=UPI003AACC29A
MTDGIHVQLAVSACDRCPVATLSKGTAVEDLRVDPVDQTVEFVAADPPTDPPTTLEIVEFAGQAHGRYDLPREAAATDGGVRMAHDSVDQRTADQRVANQRTADADSTCGDCSCGGLSAAFAAFPVSPREAHMSDGELIVSFVLTGHEELEAIVDGFEDAGLCVELRRLLVDRGGDDERADVVPVDLAAVTDRQAEVAAVAAERGYFEPDGASAEEIAADLDLAKSTVSEHLRLVTATLFSQLFADDGS